jgi:hypothetical protein
LHKKYLYDVSPGEKFMAEGYAWIGMGENYKTVFLDKVLGVVEYQADGISANSLKYRVRSSATTARVYLRFFQNFYGVRNKLKSSINHVRFSFHAHAKPSKMRFYGAISYPLGWLFYLRDLYKLRV